MKYSFLILFSLVLLSCAKKPEEKHLIPGKIFDTKWFFANGDSLLWIYSIYNTEHEGYSRSSLDRSSTYLHENSRFTLLRLKNNTLQFVSQKEASCIDHQSCGARYMDGIVAYSSTLLAFKCSCEGRLIIMDIPAGKDWTDLPGLKKIFKECAPGILKCRTPSPARQDVLELEISDGTIRYLSLESKEMIGWDKSFDSGVEINKGSHMVHIAGQKAYFAPNDGDHRSFLAVRGEKTGTSRDYKYKTGNNFWLHPLFLNKINSSEPFLKDSTFFVLHSKTWNEYQDRDLLSNINMKGETLYTIELKDLGYVSSYVTSDQFIYMTNHKGIYIYEITTGKNVKTILYDEVENPGAKKS